MSDSNLPEHKPVPFHTRHKRTLIIGVVVCVVVVGVLAALFWPQTMALLVWGKELLFALVDAVRSAGLFWFALAYAVLPAVGVPISVFNLTINPTFGPEIGLTWVIVIAAVCLNVANALSYWLARYAFRPVIEKLVRALGYNLPVIPPSEHVTACILLRVLPGPPFVVQGYILGLAKVHFLPYMVVSFLGQFGWALAVIIFGKAFMDGGSFKAAFIAIVMIVALVIGTRWVRKYYSKKSSFKGVAKTDAANGADGANKNV